MNKISLEHPNLIHVNEVFEANNTVYYVMEYLDGGSLRSYVRKHGPLSEHEALEIMQPILKAVDFLHQNRMTHLDIKPDNIMLKKDADSGKLIPTLIDFGLSKHYDKNGKPTSSIRILGCSDGYAPIEQYVGINTFTPQADVYALAATLLFTLTEKDPVIATELNKDKIVGSLPESASSNVKEAIVEAMKMRKEERIESVMAFIGMLPNKNKNSFVESGISIMNFWGDKETYEELNEDNLTILSSYMGKEIYGLSSIYLGLESFEDINAFKETKVSHPFYFGLLLSKKLSNAR